MTEFNWPTEEYDSSDVLSEAREIEKSLNSVREKIKEVEYEQIEILESLRYKKEGKTWLLKYNLEKLSQKLLNLKEQAAALENLIKSKIKYHNDRRERLRFLGIGSKYVQ